ncbi:ABC transporter ATP-binding protein [Mycoplasmopsis sturni]|uniref:ABC transporter ATP-binding protein n=1 Tax=Mycoplasmopsis sturni TaxID=39047 RepID=UPI00056253B9|nr:ABC transporter ATP-binding protein [Mycoplasmopsis sturni]
MSQYILEVKNLSKKYGQFLAVNNISFNVPKGSFHAFIGKNGSGKTTTIKSIIGLYRSFSGQIKINGIDSKIPHSRDILGYVPEKATFPSELNVYEYLFFLGSLFKIPKKDLKNKIEHYLSLFQISDLKYKKPINFSSGQKKKVLLIQALLNDPELIILDEPAANLDPYARFELFSILQKLQQEEKSIIICSHILSEIDKYATDVTLIHDGQILYSGKKNQKLDDLFYEKVIKS